MYNITDDLCRKGSGRQGDSLLGRSWKILKTCELRLGEILCPLWVDSPDICSLFALLCLPEISFWPMFWALFFWFFCNPFAGRSLFCFVEGGSECGLPRSVIKEGVAAVMWLGDWFTPFTHPSYHQPNSFADWTHLPMHVRLQPNLCFQLVFSSQWPVKVLMPFARCQNVQGQKSIAMHKMAIAGSQAANMQQASTGHFCSSCCLFEKVFPYLSLTL